MRDLSAYAAQCMRELDRLHIRYAQNITFAVNTRAKTRLGVCKKQGDRYTVEIAAPLLDATVWSVRAAALSMNATSARR